MIRRRLTIITAGFLTLQVLVFGTIGVLLVGAIIGWGGTSHRAATRFERREEAFQIAEAGIFASFPNTSFNAVFIVERGAEYQMRDCLKNGGNYYTCPSYSFGKFR